MGFKEVLIEQQPSEKSLHKNTGRLDLTKKRTLDYTKLTRLRCAVLPGMEHLWGWWSGAWQGSLRAGPWSRESRPTGPSCEPCTSDRRKPEKMFLFFMFEVWTLMFDWIKVLGNWSKRLIKNNIHYLRAVDLWHLPTLKRNKTF